MDEIRMSEELKKKIMKTSAKGEKRKGKLIRPVYIGVASGIAASFVLVFALHYVYIAPEHPAQNELAQASELPGSNTFELAEAGDTASDAADGTVGDKNNTKDNGNEKAKQQDTLVANERAEVQAQDTGKAKEASKVSEAAPATAAESSNTVSEEKEQAVETEPEEIMVASARIMSEPAAEKASTSEESLPDVDNAAAMRAAAPRSGGGGGGGVPRSGGSAGAGGSAAASAPLPQQTEEPTEEAE